MKMRKEEREWLISNGHLMEDYSMQCEYSTYMKAIDNISGVKCGGLEGFALNKGYYPITVNGLKYWIDDVEEYEESLRLQDEEEEE